MTQRREIRNNMNEFSLAAPVTVLYFNDVIQMFTAFFLDKLNFNLFMVYIKTQRAPPTMQRLTIAEYT
jgi:hypothetical protein